MFKKKDDKEINVTKVNDLVSLSHSILKILFVLLIILGVYAIIMLVKEVKILPFILTVLKILSPLFIGLVIAWLLDPIVTWLHKKGLKRGLGATVCYVAFIGVVILIIGSLIPVLSQQVNEFVTTTIPSVFNTCKGWIDALFDKINNIGSFDALAMKAEIFTKLEVFATNLTSSLPETLINIVKPLFSGIGVFAIGLIIGFYLLLDFDKNGEALYSLMPKRYRNSIKDLLHTVNKPLKRFVNGALIDCLVIFGITALGFSIIGLKSPVLFALFCAITNIIPYAGPYIGGIPAVIVGFSQNPTIGIAMIIFIIVVQAVEGNLFQPFIMSKTTKLNPVTIILGLLVFGHFFGIIGMVLSTPIMGAVKELINYFDEKYDFLNFERRI
ncbi:MAG: AI-2E family transporter [Bacilli bacterium]